MTKHKNLNIAIVCDAVTDCVAGSFVSTLRFSELLAQKGHKVIFITGRSPQNPKDNFYKNIIRTYRFHGVLLPKTDGQLYISFPSSKKVAKILRDEQIDVIHIMIPTPSAVTSMKAAKLLGVKIVAHSHTQPENLTMHIPGQFIQKPLNHLFYKYLSWLYRKADALVYPTEFAQKLLHRLETHSQIHIISNGVDTGKFKKVETEAFFQKFNLPRNTRNILYVGRLHPEKSVDTLIKAIPQILAGDPHVHFFIVGYGHLDTKLIKLAKDLGVAKNITFLGKLSDEDLVMAYSACDIFVLPSLVELEGMVVLEAMSCGKPVIVANSKNSASTYFVNGNGLLFEPENHADLARQVLFLLSDHSKLARMGEISLEKSKQYDINESVMRLEKLYRSVLK